MATTNKYLTYRGDLRAVTTFAKGVAFTTVHSEGNPTALWRLDVEKFEIYEIPLDCGGVSLTAANGSLWLGGDDARLYHLKGKAKSLAKLKVELPESAAALVSLSNDRLAALCGDQLIIVDSKQETAAQRVELKEKGTAIAADPSGDWLAVGTSKGVVSVYESEQKEEFQLSESAELHKGAVTAILFEPEELRFFSAGTDQKLLLTHARGTLEPEDRGRGASHSDHVTAMLHAPGERFISVSRDKCCKTWARAGATRPATFDDAVPAVVDATLVDIHGRPHLVIAGEDNTLRIILLDTAGRFSSMTHRLHDAYDRAAHLLQENDVALRGDAIHSLGSLNDTRAVEMLAKQITQDSDPGLRLRATELLAKSQHPRSAKLLEPLLKHDDENVRVQAFAGLRTATSNDDLRPLELAIAAQQANVGMAAVAALTTLAKKEDLARQLLIRSLDKDPEDVRRAALLALEKVYPKDSPEPTLLATQSRQHDTRRLALVRCHQRQLLSDSRVQGAVRRCGEDKHADVRLTAFLVALLSRPKLTKAIRQRDQQLHRQLFELEQFSLEPTKAKKAKEPPKLKPTQVSLAPDDFEPLLSAISSRSVDSCLLGARCLASLADPRAFGILLQLSREEDTATRVQVCRSLSLLTEARAAQRLESMLNDEAAEVRDAAYSAIERLKDPLEAADVGLKSFNVDVRRRALRTLSAALRKTKRKSISPEARELMLRSLNDDDASLCSEAFKTSLSLQIDGSQEATLRFVLNSVRVNVRGEVLTEAMANDTLDWAEQLLVELLNDASPQIRGDAYEYLLKKSKSRDITPMRSALDSRYADIRLRATQSLVKLKTKEAQAALVTAINDDHPEVRNEAITALINIDAVEILQQALSSQYNDVRLRAACARALYHDEQAKTPLIQAATATEPKLEAERPQWEHETTIAIDGLGILGDEESVPLLLPLLESKHEKIRQHAAGAIARCVRPEQIPLLSNAIQHSDPQVACRIALGLAFCKEPSALPVVFSDSAASELSDADRLMAAVVYGSVAESHLVTLLESTTAEIRNAAFLVLLMRDWRTHDGTPTRVMAALSSQEPHIRLSAAQALDVFAEAKAFARFIIELVNDRGDEQAWGITAETVETLANLIAFSEPHCRAQTTAILSSLAAEKQEQWDFAWHVHSIRYASEIEAAAKAAKTTKLPKLQLKADELSQLAFGTYVGLVREQGGYHERNERPALGASIVAIRQAAIRRLVAMAGADEKWNPAVRPVLIQAMSDELQAVRQLAFEQVAQVGADIEQRAAAAIECGHIDLAVEALKLLTAAAGKKGQKVLEDVVLTRDDELATAAGRLLLQMTDAPTAAAVGLESAHEKTRKIAVGWLASAYGDNIKAEKALVAAFQSRYRAVQSEVAIALATKKDKHAFDMLFELLRDAASSREQSRLIDAIILLGDSRSPNALLDTLENNDDKSIDPSLIFAAIGSCRLPDSSQRLLSLLDRPKWQNEVARALITISGHDQSCHDRNDDLPDRKWMDEQHPRHDDVLAAYLEHCLDLNLPDLIRPHIAAARWSLTDAVDPVLALLSVHPEDRLRSEVVKAIGWRLRKRNAPAEPLVSLLEHRDTTTRFDSAVGLARAGHNGGISILLSAVELMADLQMRILAVQALGELRDERSLDMLLRLAGEEGHALQETAAEAIGHLGQSDKANDIFDLLKRLANSKGSVARRAIVGLRWFDSPAGWDLIRSQAGVGVEYQDVVLQQLGYNDDPATRTLLLDSIRTFWVSDALPAAKRLFGDESLEPDYAALESDSYYPGIDLEEQYHCLQRVAQEGDAARIFEILPKTSFQAELTAALLQRDPPPIEAAGVAIESPDANAVEVAASIVGHAGTKEHGKRIASAIKKWVSVWNDRMQQAVRSGDWYYFEYEIEDVTRALSRLIWAAGRTRSAKTELLALLQTNETVTQFAPIRRAAITALGEFKLTKADLSTVEKSITAADTEIRRTATEVLARQDVARTAKLVGDILSDRTSFQRLSQSDKVETSPVASEAAEHAHYQAVVLPRLVASGDVSRLGDVAGNADLAETTRLGAIEGLARIADSTADKRLASIGKDESVGEEIRKAAWRSLRRSKRSQAASKS